MVGSENLGVRVLMMAGQEPQLHIPPTALPRPEPGPSAEPLGGHLLWSLGHSRPLVS